MKTVLIAIFLAWASQDSNRDDTSPNKVNPLAPSLPLLTDAEEKQLDEKIDRFIQTDIGQLKGVEAKKGLEDFHRLGSEAIPALIRGLNRAATIDGSCPALTIAKKLAGMLRTSTDTELLEFARENIGAGVEHSRHMSVIKDLRFLCLARKNAIPPGTPVLRAVRPLPMERTNTTAALVAELTQTKDSPRREEILSDLNKVPAPAITKDLGRIAASDSRSKVQSVARDLLSQVLDRQSETTLKENLKDSSREVRAAAAKSIAGRNIHLEKELIDTLNDREEIVRQAARAALGQLSGKEDFGPKPGASSAERATAIRQWRDWLTRLNGR